MFLMHLGKTETPSIIQARNCPERLQCITVACSAQVHSPANSPQATGQSQLAKK